jgi:hypothetical protein
MTFLYDSSAIYLLCGDRKGNIQLLSFESFKFPPVISSISMGKYPLSIRQLSNQKAIICSSPRPHLVVLVNNSISMEKVDIYHVVNCCNYPFGNQKYFFLTDNELQLANISKNDLIIHTKMINSTPKQIVFDQVTGMLIVVMNTRVLSKTEYSLAIIDPLR